MSSYAVIASTHGTKGPSTAVRPYLLYASTRTIDFQMRVVTKQIAGVSRDYQGNTLGGATMRLWRESDNFYCGSTTSDANGKWAFPRDRDDPFTYNVTAQLVSNGTQVHGISDRGLVPSLTGS